MDQNPDWILYAVVLLTLAGTTLTITRNLAEPWHGASNEDKRKTLTKLAADALVGYGVALGFWHFNESHGLGWGLIAIAVVLLAFAVGWVVFRPTSSPRRSASK